MTLEYLEGVQRQLLDQVQKMPQLADPTKPVLLYANLIELAGACQLIEKLIQQEKLQLAAPPGPTGPQL